MVKKQNLIKKPNKQKNKKCQKETKITLKTKSGELKTQKSKKNIKQNTILPSNNKYKIS